MESRKGIFLLCLVISVSKDRDKRSGRTISESLWHKGDGSVTLQTFVLKFYTKHIDIAKHSVYLKSFVHSTLNPIIRCYPAKEGFVCAEVEINQLEAKSAENRAKNVGRKEVGVNQKIWIKSNRFRMTTTKSFLSKNIKNNENRFIEKFFNMRFS